MKEKKEKGHKNYCILESACNSESLKGDMDSIPELERDPLEEEIATRSSILAQKKSHGERSLGCYSAHGGKELDMTEWACVTLERDVTSKCGVWDTCLDAGLEKERTAVKRITGEC